MSKKVKWGVIGPGKIAHEFASDFAFVPGGELVAVASRDLERAQQFADHFGIQKAYGSYQELYHDNDVEAIYVATTHNHHFQNAYDSLQAGKAVLCEKPIAVDLQECDELLKVAQDTGTYLMEGMWTYFLPAIIKAKEWINQGRIGKILHFKSDFGFVAPYDPQARLFNPELAGGALLDIGIYPIAAAWFFLGQDPKDLSVISRKAGTGVDDHLSIQFEYEDLQAELTASLKCQLPNWTYIIGEQGYIGIPNVWQARECFLYESGNQVDHFNDHRSSKGFNFETEAVNQDLLNDKLESDIVPHAISRKLQYHMELVRNTF